VEDTISGVNRGWDSHYPGGKLKKKKKEKKIMLVHRTKNIFTPPVKKSNNDFIGYVVGQETSF
jgi:hypothetical protein